MAAIDFPTSPTDGQTYTFETIEFTWDSASSRWNKTSGSYTKTDFDSDFSTKEMTETEYFSKTAGKYVSSSVVYDAQIQTTLTDSAGGLLNLDLSTSINWKTTLAGSNAATFNFVNAHPGQIGRIRINYSDSSNSASWQVAGGSGTILNAPTLSTDSAALDFVFYDCVDSSEILLSILKGVL